VASPSGRRRLGSDGRPNAERPRVIPAPEQRAEMWMYRLVFAVLIGAVVAYLLGWRPL
jgi:hypothetical protein